MAAVFWQIPVNSVPKGLRLGVLAFGGAGNFWRIGSSLPTPPNAKPSTSQVAPAPNPIFGAYSYAKTHPADALAVSWPALDKPPKAQQVPTLQVWKSYTQP